MTGREKSAPGARYTSPTRIGSLSRRLAGPRRILYMTRQNGRGSGMLRGNMPERELASASADPEQARTLYRNGRVSDAIAAAEATGLSDPQVRLVHASAVYDAGNAVKAFDLLASLCKDLRDRPDVERFGAEFALFTRQSNFQTPVETATTLDPLRQIATALGDATSLAGLHLAVARLEALRGSSTDARLHLDIAKRLAADASSDLRCSIELVSASPLLDTGSVDKARATAVWAFEVASSNQQLLPRSRALGNMGLFTLYLGNSKQARAYLNEARTSAGEMSFVQLGLTDSLASVALFEGNLRECSKYLDEIDALIQSHRVPARSSYARGWSHPALSTKHASGLRISAARSGSNSWPRGRSATTR